MYIICYFEELMLEWIIKLIHPLNISLVYLTLEVFHFDKSGKDINELHPSNILFIDIFTGFIKVEYLKGYQNKWFLFRM